MIIDKTVSEEQLKDIFKDSIRAKGRRRGGRMASVLEIRGKTYCPYCLGDAYFKREVDTPQGDVEIYVCVDCKMSSKH